MKPLHLLRLKNIPIYEQLQLEEALLRADEENWCLINEGSSPAVVMGISGDYDELIDKESHQNNPLPVIRRFSGGGTVVVDEETLFVSFIFNADHHDFPAFPEPIMRWSAELYQNAWNIAGFNLRENDYVIGEKKCGGNAQYIKKKRWLHHTTFLWTFDPAKMALLKMPQRRPAYRASRDHGAFLTTLSAHTNCKQSLIHSLEQELSARYQIIHKNWDERALFLNREHRASTTLYVKPHLAIK